MTFHHVGIAVESIDDSVKGFIGELKPITGKVYDGGQNATLQMFDYLGQRVELIEGAVVKNILNGSKFKIYHICLEVDNIIDSISAARKAGYVNVTGTKPAPLFDDRPVVFMLNNEGFMIEFLEKQKKDTVKI